MRSAECPLSGDCETKGRYTLPCLRAVFTGREHVPEHGYHFGHPSCK